MLVATGPRKRLYREQGLHPPPAPVKPSNLQLEPVPAATCARPASAGRMGPPPHSLIEVAEGRKEGRKEGLLPVRGLNVLKTDSHGRCIPCHAVVGEDLVRRVAAPATKTKFY